MSAFSSAPPGGILEKMPQHSSQVPSLCILIDSIIQWGPRFILGQNRLSKLPLFFPTTTEMLVGRGADDTLNPTRHIYKRTQMSDGRQN